MSTVNDLARGEAKTRSYMLCVSAGFSYDDFTSGTGLPFCTLPNGAYVLGGFVHITTVWDDSTSDTLIVGDATDPNEYVSGLDIKSAIVLQEFALSNMFDAAGAITPKIIAATDEILITITSVTDDDSQGIGNASMFYVNPSKADENYK